MARGKSITEIQILNLLDIRPMYGVEMIEEIKRLSGNTVVMSLPTLYSSLHKLSDKKLVNSYWQEAEIGGRRHVYNITKAGREYREKNKIEINYEILKENHETPQQPYATLEEAFSLPLNKKSTLPELPDTKRVLTIITPENTETAVTETKEKPKPKIQTTPYVKPNEKIINSAEIKHQQIGMNLTGTLGSTELRPLLKLNSIPVGDDFVAINLLRMITGLITAVLFIFINFLCSLSHSVQTEYYRLVYIGLLVYLAIIAAIYFVFPKIKSKFTPGKAFRFRALTTLILTAAIITICIFNHSLTMIWLFLFAFVPIVEWICMMTLRKGKVFRC